MLNGATDDFSLFANENDTNDLIYDFALGAGIGVKVIGNSKIVCDIYWGLGLNLLNRGVSIGAVGRGGLSLGYRF